MTSVEILREAWRRFALEHPDEAALRHVRIVGASVGTGPLYSDVLARSGRPFFMVPVEPGES